MADAETKEDFEAETANAPGSEQPYDEWLAQQDLTDVLREGEVWILDYAALLGRTVDRAVEYADEILNPPEKKLADLCAAFELEENAKRKADVVHFNNSQERQDIHEAAEAAGAAVDQARADAAASASASAADQPKPADAIDRAAQGAQDAGAAVVDAALGAASAVAGAVANATDALPVPKDAVHVSDGAIIFKRWHLDAPEFSYKTPYHALIGDAAIVENIRKARSMIQPVPHGDQGVEKKQYAGTMQWTKWRPDNSEGWMYVEPKGPFMDWFWKRVEAKYAEAKANADAREADSKNVGWTQREKNANRMEERTIAGARCCQLQEGLTSAINTYDRCKFTWSTGGFGAPGIDMAKLLLYLWEDENARKVMYLCGLWVGGTPNDPIYQYADVDAKAPCVYYGSNVYSEEGEDKYGKHKPGDRNPMAWKVLAMVRDSLQMLWMFIALARDELTREPVFDKSWEMERGMATVTGGEELCTEAAYVFCAEIQHEWNIHRRKAATFMKEKKNERGSSTVRWALDRFTTEEQRQLGPPSVERDKAIVKGAFRRAMQCCQEDAFPRAIEELNRTLKAAGISAGTLLPEEKAVELSGALPLYALWEMMRNYWTPMKTGIGPSGVKPHQLGESTLDVPDFPLRQTAAEEAAAGPDDVLVREPRDDGVHKELYGWWKIGTRAQCDFLFTPDARLMGYDADGRAVVRDKKRNLEWKLEKGKNTGWTRVDP